MKLDERAVKKLLSLNDEQLKNVIGRLASEAGIDIASFNMSASDAESIRLALSSVTSDDLARAAEQYENFKRGKR